MRTRIPHSWILVNLHGSQTVQRFGEKLRALRTQRGMTVRELAQALGYSAHSYVGDVEHNQRRPTADFVLKVALFFNVTTDQLMRDDLELDEDG